MRYDLVVDASGTKVLPKKPRERPVRNNGLMWYYLSSIGEIGFSIAIPIVGGAIAGSVIDKKFNTYPSATLISLGIGVVLSFVTFIRAVLNVMK